MNATLVTCLASRPCGTLPHRLTTAAWCLLHARVNSWLRAYPVFQVYLKKKSAQEFLNGLPLNIRRESILFHHRVMLHHYVMLHMLLHVMTVHLLHLTFVVHAAFAAI